MLIRRIEDTPSNTVTMPGAEKAGMRLMVGRGDGAPTFAMRVFDVAPGGCTPKHSHNYEHEIMVLAGSGQVVDGGDGEAMRSIEAGDVLYIPANEVHQFRNSGGSTLRFVCLVPTQFDCAGQVQPTPGS